MGARHVAFDWDDFLNDQPRLTTVRGALSVRTELLGAVGPATASLVPQKREVPTLVPEQPNDGSNKAVTGTVP